MPYASAHRKHGDLARGRMDVTGLKCADLVDAMGRMHRHCCHILDLSARRRGGPSSARP
jgi:hypothetical protein